MSQALYRKWRPRLWEQVVGQEHVITTLQNAIRAGRVGHAYLFAGPRGTGKTTTARLLAKAVNCLAESPAERPCDRCQHCQAVNDGRFLDLIEIDAASNTSVDDVRDLRDKINFAPTQGKYKVYIIDEVHMLSTAAFNALLKTLEEPPPHAIFILATTEVHKIPATVLSRCQRHEFRRIPVQTIVSTLKSLSEQEGLQVDDDALTLIARQATGSLRDAISLLDQLASTGGPIRLDLAQTVLGTAASQMVVELIEALQQRDAAAGLNSIHRALDSGSDPRQFARQVVDYLRGLLLVRMGNADQIEATPEQRAQIAQHALGFSLPQLMETLRLFNNAANELRTGWQPGLPLELALAQAIEFDAHPVPAAPAPAAPVIDKAAFKTPAPQPRKEASRPAAVKPAERAAQPAASHPPETEKFAEVAPPTPAGRAIMKSASTEPAEEQTQAEGAGISLGVIKQHWESIRKAVKARHPPTEALLNSCRLSMRAGVLQLGFTNELLKSKMEAANSLKLAMQAIKQAVGQEVPVVCIVVDARGGPVQRDEDIDADGMVNEALNLGAKIVHKE
jgi:DNA polymerase-3 subunit gamma/tau